MSKRYKNYIIAFIVNLLTFIISQLLDIDVIDSIVPAFFFLSSVLLIFTREPQPKKGISIPSIHFYQKTRLNMFGYTVAGSLGVAAFVFYILTYYLNISAALVSLVLWVVFIVVIDFESKFFDNYDFLYYISDYVYENLHIKNIRRKDIDKICKYLFYSNIDTFTDWKSRNRTNNYITEEIFNKCKILFNKYMFELRTDVIGDEIAEVNKISGL